MHFTNKQYEIVDPTGFNPNSNIEIYLMTIMSPQFLKPAVL